MTKKNKSLRERFREWDADRFDLTAMTAGDMHPSTKSAPDEAAAYRPIERLAAGEMNAYRAIYPLLAVLLGLVMIGFLLVTVFELPAFGAADNPANNEVTERYVRDGMTETGAVNIVAGVILDYRAFDTLGESHVLFTALTAVLILLLTVDHRFDDITTEPELDLLRRDGIVTTAAKVLVPIIVLFGVYVILNGHLGPGGGFSGGAIIGAGLILYAIAFGFDRLERYLRFDSFRVICLCALSFYSLSKCYSFFCGANGLHTIFSPGTPGRILSAGLILPLNVAVGVVVACTMYGLYSIFKRGKL
ncbi:MAG: hypothetical protein IJL59_03180 [Clostridia bacterium]|nr:hypothetical protein [Clostridia bacterium]